MEKIIIPVKSKVAKAWEKAPDELRTEITEMLEMQISQLLSGDSNRKQVLEYLRSLQKEMKNKGLTQEVLDEILR